MYLLLLAPRLQDLHLLLHDVLLLQLLLLLLLLQLLYLLVGARQQLPK